MCVKGKTIVGQFVILKITCKKKLHVFLILGFKNIITSDFHKNENFRMNQGVVEY